MKNNGLETRDSVRDYQRCQEKYEEEGIKHTREKIAKDMGLSVQQADRYKQIAELISDIQELVFNSTLGMSSVQPISTHSRAEQYEIYNILQDAISENCTLTRDCIAKIVREYRNGKRLWSEIKPACTAYVEKVTTEGSLQSLKRMKREYFAAEIGSLENMSGKDFVLWFARLLRELGYSGVTVVDASYDQGVDLLAQKEGVKYCFQCKHQKETVSISAFQEVYYGKSHDCNVAVVVASGKIAKNAVRSGEKRGIQAWDGKCLERLVRQMKKQV